MGRSGGASWARDSSHGPLSVAASTLHRLHLPRLPHQVLALQMAAALQQRSEPSHRSTRRRKMNAISQLPTTSCPFSFVFPPAFGYKMLGASPLGSHPPIAGRKCLIASSQPTPCSLAVVLTRHHHHRPHLHRRRHRKAMRRRTPMMRSSSPACR
jgi:hypothetical protein